jgi:hypothetical protein
MLPSYYEATFDPSDYINPKKEVEGLQDTFSENLLKVATQIEDDYIPLLAQEPTNRAVHPFQFATPKSRRYYFYLVNSGQVQTDDYGYVRTGGYANSWRVDLEVSGTEYTLSVYSTFPASQYVGGLKQVKGHANTGWIQYHPILSDIEVFMNSIVKRLV